MAKASVKIVVALIGGFATVLAAALQFGLDPRGSGDSEVLTYTGRVRNEANGEFLRGVEVSIDARVPKTSYTDNQGIYSVSIGARISVGT